MPSISAVADQIIGENLPAIFIDTCILLDVIRSIKRKSKDCAAQAIALHGAATMAPKQCIIVVATVVNHMLADSRLFADIGDPEAEEQILVPLAALVPDARRIVAANRRHVAPMQG